MPPKKGKGGKKGADGPAGRLYREPVEALEPPEGTPPLTTSAVKPLPLLPLWPATQEALAEQLAEAGDFGDEAGFEDPQGLPAPPASAGSDVEWRRPSEYWTAPPAAEEAGDDDAPRPPGLEVVLLPPPPPQFEPEPKKEAEEAEDSKGKKGKKPPPKKEKAKGKKGKGAEEEQLPPANVPRVILRPVEAGSDPATCTPEQELFAAVLRVVGSFGDSVGEGDFLWENIYPKGPDGRPKATAAGRYWVRVWWAGAWRRVEIDDRMPFLPESAPAGAEGEDAEAPAGAAAGQPAKLFVASAEERELWPCILYKAWLKLVDGVPGAAMDAALAIHSLTGMLPQTTAGALDSSAWDMIASLVPLNKPSRAEISAENKALWDENLRRRALAKHLAEEKAKRAEERRIRIETGQATSDDELESIDTDDMSDSDEEKAKLTPEELKAEEEAAAEARRAKEMLPLWADPPQDPRAVMFALRCTAGGVVKPEYDPEAPAVALQPGLVYGVVAARDVNGPPRVLLSGQPTPWPELVPDEALINALAEAAAAEQKAAEDAEGGAGGEEAKGEEDGGGDEKEAETPMVRPYQDPRTYDIWVPVADLPKYFGDAAIALHCGARAASVTTVHGHWRQRGEAEFGANAGQEEDPKAAKGKKGKGKDKGKGKEPEVEAEDADVNERKTEVPPNALWVRGGDAGTDVVVCMWRDPAAPLAADDSGSGDPSQMFGGSALLTVQEDVTYATLVESATESHLKVVADAQAALEAAKTAASAEGDAKAEEDAAGSAAAESKSDAPADAAAASISVFGGPDGAGLLSEGRLRVRTQRVQSRVLHVAPGQHLFALNPEAPTGYAVTFLLHVANRVAVTPGRVPATDLVWDGFTKLPIPTPPPAEGEEVPEPQPEEPVAAPEPTELENAAAALTSAAGPMIDAGLVDELLARRLGAAVQVSMGKAAASRPGDWKTWFRKVITVPAAEGEEKGDEQPQLTTVWANLHLWSSSIDPYVRLFTIDNDSGAVSSHPLLSTGPLPLAPNAKGYTLLGTVLLPTSSEGNLPGGLWRLAITSSTELPEVQDAAAVLTESGEAIAPEDSPALQSFTGTYTPNKYWLLFQDCLQLAQPAPSVAMRLTVSDPNVWVRLEVLHPITGEVLARQFDAGGALLVSLPPSGASGGEAAEAAAEVPEGEDPLHAKLREISGSVLSDANVIVRGLIEHVRWAPPSQLASKLPFIDPKAAAPADGGAAAGGDDGEEDAKESKTEDEPLRWTLTIAGAVGGAKQWVDSREAQRQAAVIEHWNEASEGRAEHARAAREANVAMLARPAGELGPELVVEDSPDEGKGKGKGKGKSKKPAKGAEDDAEAEAEAVKVRMERRRRALANGDDAVAVIGEDGKVSSAGARVTVVDGRVVHDGESELPVLPVERIEKQLADAAADAESKAKEGAAEGNEEGQSAAPTYDSLYSEAMHEALARETVSRKAALVQQRQFHAAWRASVSAKLQSAWEARETLRAAREAAEIERLQAIAAAEEED